MKFRDMTWLEMEQVLMALDEMNIGYEYHADEGIVEMDDERFDNQDDMDDYIIFKGNTEG